MFIDVELCEPSRLKSCASVPKSGLAAPLSPVTSTLRVTVSPICMLLRSSHARTSAASAPAQIHKDASADNNAKYLNPIFIRHLLVRADRSAAADIRVETSAATSHPDRQVCAPSIARPPADVHRADCHPHVRPDAPTAIVCPLSPHPFSGPDPWLAGIAAGLAAALAGRPYSPAAPGPSYRHRIGPACRTPNLACPDPLTTRLDQSSAGHPCLAASCQRNSAAGPFARLSHPGIADPAACRRTRCRSHHPAFDHGPDGLWNFVDFAAFDLFVAPAAFSTSLRRPACWLSHPAC